MRGFLPGFAYQCGVLIAGTVAYIEAVFAERFSYASAMALTAVTVFTLGGHRRRRSGASGTRSSSARNMFSCRANL